MRTLSVRYLPKKRSKFEAPFLNRIGAFFLRDLVPSIFILLILSICVLVVAEKIDRAKQTRTVTVVNAAPNAVPLDISRESSPQ